MNDQMLQKQSNIFGKNFKQETINIGSNPENDIVLTGVDVLPFHAALMKQNGHYQYILLSSDASVAIDGKNYTESPITVNEFDRVNIGGHDVMFQTSSDEGLRVFVSELTTEAATEKYEIDDEDSSPIVVDVKTPELEIDVEETADFQIEIVNGGPIVASFYLRVEGIPEEWVTIEPPIVNLNEGQRRFVRISVTPPLHSSSTAGLHNINLVVSSPNYYGHKIEEHLALTINPYYQFSLGNLSPRQKRIPWRKKTGIAYLPITNESNTTTNFNISSFDEENACSFEFNISEDLQLNRQATIPIEAGTLVNLPIEIHPHKHKLFAMSSKQHYYTTNVQIQQEGVLSPPQTVSGMATSQPLFGWWSIVLTILAILITLFIVLQPRIKHFEVAAGKDIIELGDTTRLEWAVSPFASRVSITELDEEITRGQTSLTVSPTKSTTYELVSGNWLSGLIGMDYVRKETVLVVPPAPEIGVFDVDLLEVDKGSPIKVRWSATDADELILTVDEVVYPLEEGNFSGEQEYILEDDAIITLEAKNASGSELRSYFVDVAPPQIDVVDFTVWVQPATAGNTPYQPRLGQDPSLIGMTDIPDPNFPEKLVSMVPDVQSESGYRVEFYQPDRELGKGEQIMLQWKINGVDTVQIAPFGEELPSQGLQPFFPQESMNFVLTAQSGELQQLFMLPVKVFDGEPPKAPTIEFFEASPTSMVGGGDVEFTWSVSGEWTNVQLSDADGIIEDYLFAQGFHSVTVTQSSTFILTAWNGDLSTSAPIDITIDPDLIEVGLEITDAYPTGLFMIGGQTLVTVDLFDIPVDEPDPTGEVIITDGTASCTITLPSKSCEITFTTPGVKTLYANYQGDDIYLQANSEGFPEDSNGPKIEVQSATVNLVPNYTFTDTGAYIADITTTSLNLDQGISITIEVQPSLNLPDDDKSSVNLQFCDQVTDSTTGEVSVDKDTCQFIGGGTVKIATPPLEPGQTQGYGYADIILQKFPSSGTKVFIFNYLHKDNAFEPTTEEQYNITINATEVYLNATICDESALAAFTDCSIGVLEDTSGGSEKVDIIFNILKVSNDQPISSGLAAPEASEFTFTEVGAGDDWTCSTEKINGNWKLVCNGSFSKFSSSGVTMRLTHNSGDENYSIKLGSPPYDEEDFDIRALYKIETVIGTINIAAGQTIRITGQDDGVITFWNGTTQLNTTSDPLTGSLVLEETTGIDNLLGVHSTNNCQVGYDDSSGITIDDNKIHVTAINADCDIYFTQAGNFTLKAEYLSDNSLYASSTSSDKNVQITKENNVIASWTASTNIVAGQTETAKIALMANDDDPANNNIFAPWSLSEKQLQIQLINAGTNCVIMADSDNNDGYLIDINTNANDNTIAPWIEFQYVCHTEPLEFKLSASFPEDDKDSFEISSTKTVDIYVSGEPTISMELTIDSAAPIVNQKFYAGVKYKFSFKVSTLYGSYYHSGFYNYGLDSNQDIINAFMANDTVSIQFPTALQNKIDWDKSSCGLQNTPSTALNSYTIIDQDLYDFYGIQWGWVTFELMSDPNNCYFVFSNTANVGTNTTRYIYESKYQPYYTNTIAVNGPNVAKQNTTVSLSGDSSTHIGIPLEITVTVDDDLSLEELAPLDAIENGTFDDYLLVSASCGTLDDFTIDNGTTATFTITSSDYVNCNTDNVQVTYLGNNYYLNSSDTKSVTYDRYSSTVSLSGNSSTHIGIPLEITVTMNDKPSSGPSPLDAIENGTFDDYFSISASCGTLDDFTIINGTTATFTVTSPSYYDCSTDNIQVDYKENDYYQSSSNTKSVSHNRHPSKYGTVTSENENLNNATISSTVSPNSTITITINRDDTCTHNQFTTDGKISIWVERRFGPTSKLDIGLWTLTCDNNSIECAYDPTTQAYIVDVVNGEVKVDISFLVPFTNYGTSHYIVYQYNGNQYFETLPTGEIGPFAVE